MAVKIPTTYEYKVYRNGAYLGLIPNVVSDFEYSQDIKTAGTGITITVGDSGDTSHNPVQQLTDQSGNVLTTEDGAPITTERQDDLIGSSNDSILIRNNNDLKIYEVSDNNPKGKLVFTGHISQWKASFGSSDQIEITALSDGTELDNYIFSGGDTSFISQATDTGNTFQIGDPGHNDISAAIQQFIPGSSVKVSAISVEMNTVEATTYYGSIRLQSGSSPNPAGDTVVASGTLDVSTIGTAVNKITFTSPTTLTSGQTYYIMVYCFTSASYNLILASNSNPYASGQAYTVTGINYWNTPVAQTGYDLYFVVWQYGGNTTVGFTSKDPTFILNSALADYQAKGGSIKAPTSATPLWSLPYNGSTIPSAFWGNAYAQIVQVNVDTPITGIQLFAGVSSGSVNVSASIYQGNPALDQINVISGTATYQLGGSNALKASTTSKSITNTTPQTKTLPLSSSFTLRAGIQYYVLLFFDAGSFGNLILKGGANADLPAAAATFPFGRMYFANASINNASFGMNYSTTNPSMYLNLMNTDLTVGNPDGGYKDTGNSVTYSFNQQTIKQTIESILSFSPSDWYWYVDPATSTLYFQQTSTTADHKFYLSKHINELELICNSEDIANDTYFTGGDTGGGSNLYLRVTDSTAIASNNGRVGLARISDNNVIDSGAGTTIATRWISDNKNEYYNTTITIDANTYDISTISLGQIVAFRSFGTFIDSLLLQIVSINRKPDSITLTLGKIPPRLTDSLKNISKDVLKQQVYKNPTSPS